MLSYGATKSLAPSGTSSKSRPTMKEKAKNTREKLIETLSRSTETAMEAYLEGTYPG